MRFTKKREDDGTYCEFCIRHKDNLICLVIISDLADSNTIEETKQQLDMLYKDNR